MNFLCHQHLCTRGDTFTDHAKASPKDGTVGEKIHLGWIYISILAAEEAETAPDFANSLVFLALRARSCAREQR